MFDEVAVFISQYTAKLPFASELLAIVLLAVFGAVLYGAYKALYFFLKKAAEKTKTDFDDLILANMKDPVRALAFLTAVFLSLDLAYNGLAIGGVALPKMYTLALMFVAAFALDRFLSTLFTWYLKEIAPKTESTLDEEVLPLIQKVVRVLIYVLALMLILDNLGVQITPLLAGLGVASLAVALALQDSLGNFFSGVNLSVDRAIKKGDYISADVGGVEGTVHELGWRSTKILTPNNNIMVVPNIKLAQNIVTNYSMPNSEVFHSGSIGVSYSSDPDKVCEAIKTAISEVASKSQLISKDPQTGVRLDSFGDSAITFKFSYKVKDYSSRLMAADEVNKAILRQFSAQKIEIPFPTRTLYSYWMNQPAQPVAQPSKLESGARGKRK